MSDWFYRTFRLVGRHALWVSADASVSGAKNIPERGGCLIAATHTSPYDVPILIRHVPRLLDFVSIVEVFRIPVVGWFYGNMNAFPLERARADAATTRTILARLAAGRVVVMFPEGRLRRGKDSVVRTGSIRPGLGRLVKLAGVPVIPAVIVNSAAYAKPRAWLPLRRTRYAIAFGPAIRPDGDTKEIERLVLESFTALYTAAAAELPEECRVM